METALTVMSFMGALVIGVVFGFVVTIVLISIAVGLKNGFNNFHARILPKAKPTKVRKVEIYKAVAKSLKKQKLVWILKFNVSDDRSLKALGGDFFYIRTNEIKVVHQDLFSDLRRRGYEVGTVVKLKGMDVAENTDDIESVTLTVKVK